MGIVGDRPETGVRIDVSRPQDGGPPWQYRGEAVTAGARFGLMGTISEAGFVTVELETGAPAGMAERARLLLKAAWKHATDEHSPPPRRIVRWRPDGEN
jgi:hypothetical protein